jgi:hypothetical protein
VPPTWKIFRAEADPTPPTIAPRLLRLASNRTVLSRALQRLGEYVPKDLADEALSLFRLAAICTLRGTMLCLLGLVIFKSFHPMPDVFLKHPGDITGAEFLTAVAAGLWLANLAVLWRTTAR